MSNPVMRREYLAALAELDAMLRHVRKLRRWAK